MRTSLILAAAVALLTIGLAPGAAALHEKTVDCMPADHPFCQIYDAARHAPHELPPVPGLPDVDPCEDGAGVVMEGTPVCVESRNCDAPPGTVAAGAVIHVGPSTVDTECQLVGLEPENCGSGVRFTLHPTGLQTTCIVIQ